MNKKRVQFDITDQGLKDILILKDQLYVASVADAIRSSLRIVKKLEDEKRKGNKIVIIEKNNKQRELEFI